MAGTGEGPLLAAWKLRYLQANDSYVSLQAGDLAKPDLAAYALLGRRIHLR